MAFFNYELNKQNLDFIYINPQFRVTVKSLILIILAIVLTNDASFSQCSDAGICSVGEHTSERNNAVSFGAIYGSSGKDDDISFFSFKLSGMFFPFSSNEGFFQNSSFVVEAPFNIQKGPAGSVNGFGDLTILFNQPVYKSDFDLIFTIGAKIATANVNANSLPQAYQSGLGTNDILLGLSLVYESLNFSAGYQKTTGRSSNSLTRLKRGDDLLIKTGYRFKLDNLTLSPELLYIQRIGESNVIVPSVINETFISIPGSDQNQLNLLVNLNYRLGEDYSLQAGFALPFIKRKINVDGLTRKFSAGVELQYYF
jgi:hypothetical protein